jgi:hypothetical protein
MSTKKKALHSEIAWNALMRELRSVKKCPLDDGAAPMRKKRRAGFDQQDMSLAGDSQERKVRCVRSSKALSSDDSNTFLDLTPPMHSLDASPSFTFGRHYKQISLAGLAKSSCLCSGESSAFDVFSSYRCPCKSRLSKMPVKSTTRKNIVSSAKKSRAVEAI